MSVLNFALLYLHDINKSLSFYRAEGALRRSVTVVEVQISSVFDILWLNSGKHVWDWRKTCPFSRAVWWNCSSCSFDRTRLRVENRVDLVIWNHQKKSEGKIFFLLVEKWFWKIYKFDDFSLVYNRFTMILHSKWYKKWC